MKKLVQTEQVVKKVVEKVVETKNEIKDVENEGLIALIGKEVLIFCANYFYAGKLIGVNHSFIMLENGGIVYETGAFDSKGYKDFQLVNKTLYIQTAAIEAFSEGK